MYKTNYNKALTVFENQIRSDFIDFLKKHRAYKSFLKNVFANGPIRFAGNFYSAQAEFLMLKHLFCKQRDFLTSAFAWSETEEDFVFWDDLDNLWQDYLNKVNDYAYKN